MAHRVRSTLVLFGLSALGQRLLQLAAFALVGRALPLAQLGVYAQGLAIAGLLAVLAGAPVRLVLTREMARAPQSAGPLLRLALRTRLRNTGALLVPALLWAWTGTAAPWFWTLSLLLALPLACDGKLLFDAMGLARREVGLETTAAALQLALVAVWLACGGGELWPLVAIALGCRSLYALGVLHTAAALPRSPLPFPASVRPNPLVGLGQAAHEVLAAGDVWFVALWFGDAAAGGYALAQRLGAAALLPSAQLVRLLLPHLLRAPVGGDRVATVRAALRATAFAALPVLAGGLVVAEPLCAWFGPEHRATAPVLRLWLAGSVLLHLGWQCSHALLAAGRDRAYALGLLGPAVLQLAWWAWFAAPGAGELAAGGFAAAHAVYLAGSLFALRAELLVGHRRWLTAPLLAALATAAGAALPCLVPGAGGLPWLLAQLAVGGAGGLWVLWRCELRGRWQRLGDGLAGASGFRV